MINEKCGTRVMLTWCEAEELVGGTIILTPHDDLWICSIKDRPETLQVFRSNLEKISEFTLDEYGLWVGTNLLVGDENFLSTHIETLVNSY